VKFLFSLAVFSILAGAQQQKQPLARTAAAAPVHTRATKPLPNLTDPQLETAIRAKFAKSKINTDKFTVRVSGGTATIEGKTEIVQHKGTATRMAKTAGARQVINKVQVSDAAKAKANENLASGRRRAQVKRSDAR
jgi:BON domain